MPIDAAPLTAEEKRLEAARTGRAPWRRFGPYVSERQWGTVREDYSARGTAWEYFPHDIARSRAYRWGEDGIGGISDRHQRRLAESALELAAITGETAVAAGKTQTREGVYLQLAETGTVDASLAADATQIAAVKVTGANNSIFDPNSMGATTSISREQIAAFASIQRNLQDYARIDPRVAQTDKERGEMSIAGQNIRANTITIDGVNTSDTFGLEPNSLPTAKQPISIDAIDAVQVNISNYDVTQTGYTGGNINAVTKSGTNEFHGSVSRNMTASLYTARRR